MHNLGVRLHEHGRGIVSSFEATFLPPGEIRPLLSSDPHSGEKRAIRLYLDGLDELPDVGRQEELVKLAQEGMSRYPHFQIVMTARNHVTGPWLGWLPRVCLAPFDATQSRELASKWLDQTSDLESFCAALNESPSLSALMSIPLLATLIVNLYRQTGKLPATKPRLYRIFVDLLSGGWDAVKQTHRGCRFGPEPKILVLSSLAVQMQYARKRDATEEMFRAAVDSTLPALEQSWHHLLDEIIQDGLLVRSGVVLLFSHMSFQEYLAGRALHRDPSGRKARDAVSWFLKGDDWWKEPAGFYIGASEAPDEAYTWLCDVIDRVGINTDWGRGFESRAQYLKMTLIESFPGYQRTK